MMLKMKLTQEELKRQLRYDPKTGIFTRKVSRGNAKAGDVAGSEHHAGYIEVGVNGKLYLAHRLAWMYVHGYLPENDIDHIDRVRNNNQISNLREASKVCNARNTGNRHDNTSGVKGVSWYKQKEKWIAQIKVNGKLHYLGLYEDFDEAVCTRLATEQCLGWSGCDSSSPAFQYVQKNIIKNTC